MAYVINNYTGELVFSGEYDECYAWAASQGVDVGGRKIFRSWNDNGVEYIDANGRVYQIHK